MSAGSWNARASAPLRAKEPDGAPLAPTAIGTARRSPLTSATTSVMAERKTLTRLRIETSLASRQHGNCLGAICLGRSLVPDVSIQWFDAQNARQIQHGRHLLTDVGVTAARGAVRAGHGRD